MPRVTDSPFSPPTKAKAHTKATGGPSKATVPKKAAAPKKKAEPKHIHGRDGKNRFIRTIETMMQDQQAAELRSRSLTYQQIATELGFNSKAAAFYAVERGFALVPTEKAASAKAAELEKLDRIERHLLSVMLKEHIKVDHGRIITATVMDPATGNLVPQRILDSAPGIQAAAQLIRVSAERRKLLGLDEPSKHRIDVYPHDKFVEDMEKLNADIAEAERILAAQEAAGA